MKELKLVKQKIETIIKPENIIQKKIVKSGNGAIVYVPKKHLNKQALIIIQNK